MAGCSLLCTRVPRRAKDGGEEEVRDGQRNLTSFTLLSRLPVCEVEGAHLALWQLKPFWGQTFVLERTTPPTPPTQPTAHPLLGNLHSLGGLLPGSDCHSARPTEELGPNLREALRGQARWGERQHLIPSTRALRLLLIHSGRPRRNAGSPRELEGGLWRGGRVEMKGGGDAKPQHCLS